MSDLMRSDEGKHIIFIGDLPPPTHGASVINQRFLDLIKPKVVIDSGPKMFVEEVGKPKLYSILKGIRFFTCLARLCHWLVRLRSSTVYCSVNGGFGQVYNIFYVLLARVFGSKLILHHHSYSYINHHSLLFENLLRVCPSASTTHVVLAKSMEREFLARYPSYGCNTAVVSNIGLIEDARGALASKRPDRLLVIGHMANLCEEKGLLLFLKLVSRLQERGLSFRAVIAGPVDDKCAQSLQEAVATNKNLDYLGPLYGDKKEQFFQSLDCFVFPSKYRHEAEPLVLYEAAQYGCTLVGTEQGAMREAIHSVGGISKPYTSDYDWIEWAAQQLINNDCRDNNGNVRSAYASQRGDAIGALQKLF